MHTFEIFNLQNINVKLDWFANVHLVLYMTHQEDLNLELGNKRDTLSRGLFDIISRMIIICHILLDVI